ncbi:MAG TPA: hypothetical protein VLA22_01830 [Gaiellaceae bacterium]|nr:hypothetical protein [Gaiellaceae bacterium]
MCLIFLMALFAPRVAFALIWIFGDRVDLAFSSWVWALLLLIFLPWTGIMYSVMWSPVVGVDGAEWIVIVLAVIVDLMSWSARAAKSRYRSAY